MARRSEEDEYRRGTSHPGAELGFPRSDVVADLTRQSLRGMAFERLVGEVCRATADLLEVDYVDVFELQTHRDDLVLRHGVGWPEEAYDEVRLDASPDSQTGYTMRSWQPTVVEDSHEEERFDSPGVFEEADIRSSVTVVVPAPVDPWGVFGVRSTQARAFDEQDTMFVQSMGHVLSQQIRFQRANRRLVEEKERFDAIVEEVREYAIFIMDTEGHVRSWNKGAQRIKGYAEEDILGEHFSVFYTEEDRQAGIPERNLRRAAEEGSFEDEGWRLRKDGSRFWANVTITALHDQDGRVHAFAKVTRDTTERRERERRLASSRKTIVDNFPNGAVGLVDEDLRIRMVGGRPAARFDRPLEELEGMNLQEAIPDPLRDEMVEAFQAALEGESRTFDHEGDDRVYRIRTVPVRDEEGEIFAALGMSQDVTEEKRHQEELAASNQRLEQFAYIASHDMQEPLRMVATYLQLLDERYRDRLDEDGREFLAHAVDGAKRMNRMIDSLLRYSRVTTQAEPFRVVDAGGVLADVLSDLEIQIRETDAEITVGQLPRVEADADQLAQVFRNLVSNALKYSGDEPPRIHVDADREDGRVRFSVIDEGVGIPTENSQEIFEAFKRLRGAGDDGGTGIGLAICERIVDRHGGEIWVDSELGEGSAFHFTMPAEPDEA